MGLVKCPVCKGPALMCGCDDWDEDEVSYLVSIVEAATGIHTSRTVTIPDGQTPLPKLPRQFNGLESR